MLQYKLKNMKFINLRLAGGSKKTATGHDKLLALPHAACKIFSYFQILIWSNWAKNQPINTIGQIKNKKLKKKEYT